MKNRKSTLKKIAAMAVALVMCAAMLPGAALATDTTVHISTKADLDALAEAVNDGDNDYDGVTVVLDNDIDLGGAALIPIGNWENPFRGTFDGGDGDGGRRTIKNGTIAGNSTYIRAGLFGCVEEGTVQNLILDNIQVSNSSTSNSTSYDDNANESATGAAVATLLNGTIRNVLVTNTCTVSGYYRTGGVVGDTRESDSHVIDCTNKATVRGDSLYTGGIVGAAHDIGDPGSQGTEITGCHNWGGVTGTTNVGGIVGYSDRAVITDCDNLASGTITGSGNYGTGGIVGANVYNYYFLANYLPLLRPSVSSIIQDCENYGAVGGGRAGGILGAYISAPGKVQPQRVLACTITGCTSAGAVTGTTGICGAIYGGAISYANGDGATYVSNMVVSVVDCTFDDCTVNGNTVSVPGP